MPKQPCRIVIADDHAIVRAGLRVLLDSHCEHLVIGEASDGYEAIRMVTQLSPELLLIDLSMPRMGGTEAIRILRKQYQYLKIIALTMHHNEEYIRAAFEAGCNGYMVKDDTHQELFSCITSVMEWHSYLSQSICNQVVDCHIDPQANICNQSSWGMLTQRELEIIKLIAEGNTNKMIARMLFISVKTVEKHRSNMMKKLGLHSASRITAYAIENSLV